ncbi:hypothetical protein D3C85_1493340 [compost metagenome]
MQSIAVKMCRCFPYIWRMGLREVCRIISGNIRIIIGKIRTDHFAMHSFEIIIRFAVTWIYDEIKITCAHA